MWKENKMKQKLIAPNKNYEIIISRKNTPSVDKANDEPICPRHECVLKYGYKGGNRYCPKCDEERADTDSKQNTSQVKEC